MSWEGDWMCGGCQHINFKKRDMCQRCGFPKYGGKEDASAFGSYNTANVNNRTEVLAGDWYCQASNCGSHNYASRMNCFRCGTQKTEHAGGYYGGNDMMACIKYGSEAGLPGWKTGDWICSRAGCGIHNYACRMECYKCKMPREFGENPSSSSSS